MDRAVKGSIRQRSAGSWELTVDLGRVPWDGAVVKLAYAYEQASPP